MADNIVVQLDTCTAIEEVAESLADRALCLPRYLDQRPIRVGSTLIQLRRQLLKVNDLVKRHELRNERSIFYSETSDDWIWLTYIVDHDVIPIYGGGITVSSRQLIATPKDIPYLVRFLTATGTNNGLDVDNHNFGYHFQFGNVRRIKLHRTNLLLTFKPTDPYGQSVPLHAEKHGTYTPIHVATIGSNKRRPIYDVCHTEMTKKGIANFKTPANGSSIFYS